MTNYVHSERYVIPPPKEIHSQMFFYVLDVSPNLGAEKTWFGDSYGEVIKPEKGTEKGSKSIAIVGGAGFLSSSHSN